MKISFIYELPMWFSFALIVVGFVFSLLLARRAYGGVLFPFTAILTVGILVFGLHHLAELWLSPTLYVSEGLEVLSSLIFLAAAIYLAYRLKNIIHEP